MELMPLVQGLLARLDQNYLGFHTPGHHSGLGIAPAFHQAWQRYGLQLDVSELPGLDNLAAPEGIIAQAQARAAATFGADHTWFLVNGATVGVMAAILATTGPGQGIIVPRNCHQSVLSGVIVAGATPIFVTPQFAPTWGLAWPLTAADLDQALTQYPQAQAVLITAPTYEGIAPDIAAIVERVHQANLPLIVDAAHGSHFSFHPALPPCPLQAGADVVIHSIHKTLGGLTQAAMLHHQGERVSPERLRQWLRVLQTSSPSYLLLASLDAAQAQMATRGQAAWQEVLDLVAQIQQALPDLKPLTLLQDSEIPGPYRIDPTRITLGTWPLKLTGFAADQYLEDHHRVTAEFPTLNYLTFILGLGHTTADVMHLIKSWRGLLDHGSSLMDAELWTSPQAWNQPNLPHLTTLAVDPRTALFQPQAPVTAKQAIGQISAAWICPYPPGIPLLFPGEIITPAVIEQLNALHQAGATITGCPDPTLQTFQILS